MGYASSTRRVFAHVPDNILRLHSAEFTRPIAAGNTWTRIRIGVMCSVPYAGPTAAEALTDCTLYAGMCSSFGPGPLSRECGNFVGASLVGSPALGSTRQMTYTAGNNPYYIGTSYNSTPCWIVGQQITVGTNSGTLKLPLTEVGYIRRRGFFIIEINRPVGYNGAYRFYVYSLATTHMPFDLRPHDMYQALDLPGTPTLHGIGMDVVVNNVTINCSEVSGPLNTLYLGWQRVLPLEVSAIGAVILDSGIYADAPSRSAGMITFATMPEGTLLSGMPVTETGYGGTMVGNPMVPIATLGFNGTYASAGSYGMSLPVIGYCGTSGESSWDAWESYGTGTLTSSVYTGTNWTTYGTIKAW